MGTTLDDLARLSGVSRATVSRVINGGSVSEDTRQRVTRVMEETGYRPNLAARSLATGKTGVIGVLMHVAARKTFGDDYFSELLVGVSDALSSASKGMMLWLGNRSSDDTLDMVVNSTLVDGVVATADSTADSLADGLRLAPFPVVFVGHRLDDDSASYVDVDNIAAAHTATSHLIDIGRTRIGHIAGRSGSISSRDRIAGYEQAMAEAGLSTEHLIAWGDYEPETAFEAARHLLSIGVDAIFCGSDNMAQGAATAIKGAGLSIPGDVALVGFDDIGLASTMSPSLTTMRQDMQSIGREAAGMILTLIDNPDDGPFEVLLPTKLIVRESTVGNPATTGA